MLNIYIAGILRKKASNKSTSHSSIACDHAYLLKAHAYRGLAVVARPFPTASAIDVLLPASATCRSPHQIPRDSDVVHVCSLCHHLVMPTSCFICDYLRTTYAAGLPQYVF